MYGVNVDICKFILRDHRVKNVDIRNYKTII